MEKLTLKEFQKIKHGTVFATGFLPNNHTGIVMTDGEGDLRWVAKKGIKNDWSIYCHWAYHNPKWIADYGDKVHTDVYIKRCVDCNDEVFNLYQH